MKRIIKILITILILIGETVIPKKTEKTDGIIIKKYWYARDRWCTDNGSYKFRLILTGRPPKATETITFIVLSNSRDIDFSDISKDIFENGKKEKDYILAEIGK